MTTTVRLFAAAAEAAGTEQLSVEVGDGVGLSELLGRLPGLAEPDSSGTPDLTHVLDRCSFLINGVRSTPSTALLRPGDQLDVMPPFAGG